MVKPIWGLYLGNNRVMVQPHWSVGKLLAFADDLSLTPGLLTDGMIEPGLSNYMAATIRPPMTVIDVGANLGYFTVLAGLLVGKQGLVLAYEPCPEMYGLLIDNLTINDICRQVVAVRKAVTDVTGSTTLHVSKRFRGNSSIMPHSAQYTKDFASDEFEAITVDGVALDDCPLARGLPQQVDLVKIDVEGGEYRVLKGMQQLIAGGRVRTVAFEINQSMLQGDAAPLVDLLKQFVRQYGAVFSRIHFDGTPRPSSVDELFGQEYIDNVLMQLPA